jgi:hypothetical protein
MTKIFGVGTRVVCIDGKFDPFVWEFVDEVPVEGGIYTISGMCFESNCWETGNVAPGFFFEEIPEGLPGFESRVCWEAQRFDPIVDADEAEKRTAKRPRSRRKKSLTICTNRHPIVA